MLPDRLGAPCQFTTNGAASGGRADTDASADPIDPRAFGLTKAAYGVGETLELLSIGRTSLYAAVKRGDLKRVKLGKKTLFYAADIAWFLERLARLSEAMRAWLATRPELLDLHSGEAAIAPMMLAAIRSDDLHR